MSRGQAMGGHQSAAAITTTWLTPPPVIEGLGGPESFDLDPCAFAGSPIRTARHAYALPETDGLAAEWFGRVWLNPPYSTGEVEGWLQRLTEHGDGCALAGVEAIENDLEFSDAFRTWFASEFSNEPIPVLMIGGEVAADALSLYARDAAEAGA